MLIDTHAHLNFKDFKHDWEKVVETSLAHNVWVINVGSNYETSKKAVEIAEKYENGVYAAIGLHPIHAQDGFAKEKYRSLAHLEKVAAIGEIGLDYYRDYGKFKEKQKQVFCQQISLAQEINLPIIFHCRKAHHDLLEILKGAKLRGVIHCFSGDWSLAQKYLDMGFYLGFNGIIYKLDLKKVIEKTPLDRILLETDCPFLGNEPIFVKYIAKDIARIKSISFDQVAKLTTQNAQNLFGI